MLILIDSLAPEAGTENHLSELIRRMDSRRVEITIGCMDDSARLQSLALYASVLLFPVNQVFSLTGMKQILRLRREINRRSIEIVHAVLGRSIVLGVLSAYLSRCQVIVTSRRNLGYWFSEKPIFLKIYRFMNRLTTRVLVNSERTKQATARLEGLSLEKIDVLYNGVDPERFQIPRDEAAASELGLEPTTFVVGIVANLRPVKNLPLFLRAAQLVLRQALGAIFVIVGRGPLKTDLEKLARNLGIANQVRFVDQPGDVARYVSLFSVACLSSASESFSNAILEYMAAGLPVVATDVGGAAEAIEDGRTGFIVQESDDHAFASAILTLFKDPALRASMGERGRQRCRERFSLQMMVRQNEDYYFQLARKRR